MATSNAPPRLATALLAALAFTATNTAVAHEAATPAACQAAAERSPIADDRALLDRKPNDVSIAFRLADDWSDAGCFAEGLQVLERTRALHPDNKELETRLRVARSLVGEEHFFDDLDRADVTARQKRAAFRCNTLADAAACAAANPTPPQNPVTAAAATTTEAPAAPTPIVTAPAESAPATVRIARAETGTGPPRRYSNAAPESQSH